MIKKNLVILALITIFMIFASACEKNKFDRVEYTLSPEYAEAVENSKYKEAEKALTAEKLELALELFLQAGEKGKPWAEEIIAELTLGNYEVKYELIEKNNLDRSRIIKLITERLFEKNQEVFGKSQDLNFRLKEHENYLNRTLAKEIELPTSPRNAFYLEWAKYEISKKSYNRTRDYEELLSLCEEGSEGHQIYNAIKGIKNGKYLENIIILENLKGDIFIDEVFPSFLSRDNMVLEKSLDYYYSHIYLDKENDKTLLESINATDWRFGIGYDRLNGFTEYTFSEEEISQLPTVIGTQPKGKILILKKYITPTNIESKLSVCVESMKRLPKEYYPRDLSEVEYIIYMDCTYKKSKEYKSLDASKTVTSVLNIIDLLVYDVVSDEVIYKNKIKEEPYGMSIFGHNGGDYHWSNISIKEDFVKIAEIIQKKA